jgi:hypothetical protein
MKQFVAISRLAETSALQGQPRILAIGTTKRCAMKKLVNVIFSLGLMFAFPVVAAEAQSGAVEQSAVKKKKKKTPMERFRAADTNDDGKISRAELHAAGPQYDCLYDFVDKDGDDAVTTGDLLMGYLSWISGVSKPPSGDARHPCETKTEHDDDKAAADGR